MATSQDFVNWVCSDALLPRFLQYLLLAEGDDLLRFASGSVHQTIYFPEAKAFHICLPSLPEQRRIVAILDEAFEGIAAAKASTEKSLASVLEAFHSQVHQVFRAAYARGRVHLKELAADITDGDHLPPPKSQRGVPFITIGDIDKASRTIDFTDTFKVPRSYFDGLKANRRPRKGDVLYTVTGSFGIPVLVDFDEEFCFQRHIALVRPSEATDSKWLMYLLQSPQIMKQANEQATGTAQKTVSLKALRGFVAPTLPVQEQRRDTDLLSAMEQQVRAVDHRHRRKAASLDELKASLLHQAFTGQL